MNQVLQGSDLAARRAQVEASLARYPDLSSERLDDVLHWFRYEASALDVGHLASNEAIADRYRKFRADHIDPVKGRDVFWGIAFLALLAIVFLLIIWRAL